MLKNMTLSAEGVLIEKARQRAKTESTTLNAEFRKWLAHYAKGPENVSDFRALMERLNYAQPGKPFRREELNER